MSLIRYFCPIDITPAGVIALAHLDALREVSKLPIRIIGTSLGGVILGGDGASRSWARHRDLISTPLEPEFVNVVCAPPERWDGLYTARTFRGTRPDLDRSSGCLKNILILTEAPSAKTAVAMARYEVVLNRENMLKALAAEKDAALIAELRRSVDVKALAAAVGG